MLINPPALQIDLPPSSIAYPEATSMSIIDEGAIITTIASSSSTAANDTAATTADDTAVAAPKPIRKKKEAPKAPKAPKRGASAYSHYVSAMSTDQMAKTIAALGESATHIEKFTHKTKALAALWKDMSDDQKAPYVAISDADKVRYKTEQIDYLKKAAAHHDTAMKGFLTELRIVAPDEMDTMDAAKAELPPTPPPSDFAPSIGESAKRRSAKNAAQTAPTLTPTNKAATAKKKVGKGKKVATKKASAAPKKKLKQSDFKMLDGYSVPKDMDLAKFARRAARYDPISNDPRRTSRALTPSFPARNLQLRPQDEPAGLVLEREAGRRGLLLDFSGEQHAARAAAQHVRGRVRRHVPDRAHHEEDQADRDGRGVLHA